LINYPIFDVEHIILALLSDESIEKRRHGYQLLKIARQVAQPIGQVRKFKKIQAHQVNWGALNYYDFIDFTTVPVIYEPSLTKDLSLAQLDQVVDGLANIVELCCIEEAKCHTQVK
jgi:hypothetical protein